MTCYQRHLSWLFDDLGLDYDKGQRARVDSALHEVLGLAPEARCPEVWAAVKERYGIDTRARSVELVADVSARLGL